MAEEGLVVRYDVTEAKIAELAARYAGVKFDTPEAYEAGRLAIGVCRDLRVKVEKRRKELKADSLEYGRRVDRAARTLTDLIEAVENPMLEAKRLVDEAAAERKRQQEKAELLALEAKLKADREAEEVRLAEERRQLEEEGRRLAAERAAADEVRAAEQAKLKREREDLDRQRREVERAQVEQRRVEDERLARERAAAEEVAAREREAAEAARLEAMRPDIDKVHLFAEQIAAFISTAPVVAAPEARVAVDWAKHRLLRTAEGLHTFRGAAS